MGVYKIMLAGRVDPLHVKAKSKTEAIEAVVNLELLTGDEVVDALADGVKLWTPGTAVPADRAPETVGVEVPNPASGSLGKGAAVSEGGE